MSSGIFFYSFSVDLLFAVSSFKLTHNLLIRMTFSSLATQTGLPRMILPSFKNNCFISQVIKQALDFFIKRLTSPKGAIGNDRTSFLVSVARSPGTHKTRCPRSTLFTSRLFVYPEISLFVSRVWVRSDQNSFPWFDPVPPGYV